MAEGVDLRGKRVLVVGLATTGMATARFLRAKGATVSTTEMKTKEEMGDAVREVEGIAVRSEWGGHRPRTFLGQDLVVMSPGVDLKIDPVKEALKRGIPVISEVELAYRFLEAPIIAVTGTNGKTTTTLLIGEMLKEAGKVAAVGGNVGKPLILFAEGSGRWDVVVAEISSFQLEAIELFRPKLSVLLNVTQDHLDRYARYEDYIAAKARIFMNQLPEDLTILNRDDSIVREISQGVKAKVFFFSLQEELQEGAFRHDQGIRLRLRGKEEDYPLAKTRLKGIHNVENMMAAILAARLFGCPQEAVERALGRFEGLEHRLEYVREIGGVRFFNDSKGTNVGSVVKSLGSFFEPVILIAGGKDKRTDLGPLRDLVRQRVRRLILIGEAKERMARELGGLTDTVMAGTLEEAVLLAYETAREGDVVLLSPACSSYDMFHDYKERGEVFKEAVRRL